jgi:hypothetical protein
MTPQPPATIADCTALVSEALAALVGSGLTPEQKQHVGTLVNAYIYASRLCPN